MRSLKSKVFFSIRNALADFIDTLRSNLHVPVKLNIQYRSNFVFKLRYPPQRSNHISSYLTTLSSCPEELDLWPISLLVDENVSEAVTAVSGLAIPA